MQHYVLYTLLSLAGIYLFLFSCIVYNSRYIFNNPLKRQPYYIVKFLKEIGFLSLLFFFIYLIAGGVLFNQSKVIEEQTTPIHYLNSSDSGKEHYFKTNTNKVFSYKKSLTEHIKFNLNKDLVLVNEYKGNNGVIPDFIYQILRTTNEKNLYISKTFIAAQ
jgi:hypothetical protein